MNTVEFTRYIEREYDYTVRNPDPDDEDPPTNFSGTYVLASEAQDEINKANADWIERCSKFRKQDAEEANERVKVLEGKLESVLSLCDQMAEQATHNRLCIKALVDAAKKVVTTTKQHIDCDCNLCKIKAALAERK